MTHTHVPKLVEYGYVADVAEGRRLRRGPDFGEVASVLERVADGDGTLGFEVP